MVGLGSMVPTAARAQFVPPGCLGTEADILRMRFYRIAIGE